MATLTVGAGQQFGTISAAAALPLAGIQGPTVGGYLLVSQLLLSSQTVVLALVVLGWWLVRRMRLSGGRAAGGEPLLRPLADLLSLSGPRQMVPVYVEAGQAESARQQ